MFDFDISELYDLGYRPCDRDALMVRFGLTGDEADEVCDRLSYLILEEDF